MSRTVGRCYSPHPAWGKLLHTYTIPNRRPRCWHFLVLIPTWGDTGSGSCEGALNACRYRPQFDGSTALKVAGGAAGAVIVRDRLGGGCLTGSPNQLLVVQESAATTVFRMDSGVLTVWLAGGDKREQPTWRGSDDALQRKLDRQRFRRQRGLPASPDGAGRSLAALAVSQRWRHLFLDLTILAEQELVASRSGH